MPNPVVTWVLELNPSEKTTFELTNIADLKITNATLDPVLEDETGRSTVILHIITPKFEDSEDEEDSEDASEPDLGETPPQKLVLTSLTPGKIESTVHDIVVTRPATVVCEVIGKNTIHLSGYLYVPDGEDDSDSSDGGFMGTDDDSDESDEDYLDEMQHDLEPDDSELDDERFGLLKDSGRFEEVDSEEEKTQKTIGAPKQGQKAIEASKKRARESEDEEAAAAPKLSKKQRKKLKAQQAAAEASGENKAEAPPQKKQKAEDGKAVPVLAGKKEAQPNGAAGSSGKKEKEKAKGEKEKEKNGKEATTGKAVKHPSGLITTDIKIGTGATAKKGSRLGLRYIGKLSNGTVFDSNTNGKPFKFQLNKGQVIKGWDEGVVGMKVGGERQLVIPPQLGYGKQKISGIPPNSTLTFEVKLLEIS